MVEGTFPEYAWLSHTYNTYGIPWFDCIACMIFINKLCPSCPSRPLSLSSEDFSLGIEALGHELDRAIGLLQMLMQNFPEVFASSCLPRGVNYGS